MVVLQQGVYFLAQFWLGGAKLVKIKITSAGNYVVVATRRGRDKGNTEGAYVLTLDNGQ